ncbi:hypothetical protein BTJ68_08021 [Hortaea werneckii EXF-2000]|uniref:Pseudouridine synthase I TruA alpha/beta domain-containing protein n=1 Tax=Hortaea werneckii EXF-2000 TaxID=1157616 RepID=A0A1Z5TA13_HORWE|nr:hypothetical protein BTJ68_08021 [Hortaea werneckii EXF-2000]
MVANTGNSKQTKQDYTQLSHADLVTRVTDLEQQLRTLNAKHTASSTTSSPAAPPKKKPKKPAKPFDPSKYNTRFIALKFAYLGGEYNGFEHHSNNTTPLPTVEEELWRGLRKTRLIFPDFTKVRGDEGEVCWDGVEYSKCGRTDRGVSAFGQVVGLRVRSSQPKGRKKNEMEGDGAAGEQGGEGMSNGDASAALQSGSNIADTTADAGEQNGSVTEPSWDSIRDELPYIQLLNRVLPPSIRILAWCPHPPQDFSARFSCKERRYRYFFTNPAYPVGPGSKDGVLNVPAMQDAAKKYEGLHDFRNFCKVDPSKQITNFERRIFSAGIYAVGTGGGQVEQGIAQNNGLQTAKLAGQGSQSKLSEPELYYFEVRGSAFLWHQVRHLIAVLFLVGQGYEHPSIVDKLLDTNVCPSKPVYEMADDRPLVLWDCVFPDLEKLAEQQDHIVNGESGQTGRERSVQTSHSGIDDGKFGRNGIMDELWAQWRQRKIDEVLAGHLMDVVSGLGSRPQPKGGDEANGQNGDNVLDLHKDLPERSDRVFDGSDRPRTVGTYIPVLQRERMETPDVVNARYAARKGLAPKATEMDLD